jgi:hypothetical protein
VGSVGAAVPGEMQRAFEQHGVSDDGTPWTAFYELDHGEFVVHIARHGRGYVLLWPDQTSVPLFQMEKLVQLDCSSAKLQTKLQTWH